MDIKYCTQCSAPVNTTIPKGDTHTRHVCTSCGFIHYQNPKIVAGCLVHRDNMVLLCKRAIEPRHGLWTVPAGFMENGETTRQAAQREAKEEAGVTIAPGKLFLIANSPHANHVNLIYLAELTKTNYHATHESSEVKLFTKDEIPWNSIAFHTIKLALTWFFEDLEKGQPLLHEIDF